MIIQHGKMHIRNCGSSGAAILGVIAVPSYYETEVLYPARLSSEEGLLIQEESRTPVLPYNEGLLDELDMNALFHMPIFSSGANENCFEVFLRDTDIPNAPEGCKWVLAAAPSKQHPGDSRTITIKNGKVSVVAGDLAVGNSINGVAILPIWGNQSEPYGLCTTIVFSSLHKVAKFSPNDNPNFNAYRAKMKELSPLKSCYTADELVARDVISESVMQSILHPGQDVESSKNEIWVNGVLISLTLDGYSYNDQFYTLEVSVPDQDENDGDISSLSAEASEEEVKAYLHAAADVYKNGGFNTVKGASSRIALKLNEASGKKLQL